MKVFVFRMKTETRTHAGDVSTKTSRLPSLPEEENSEPKIPENVPVVREEADGKDEATEVLTHDTHLDDLGEFSSSISSSPPSPPGPGDLKPVPAPVVSGHHQQLPGGEGHQLQHLLEERSGLLRHPASLPSRENV